MLIWHCGEQRDDWARPARVFRQRASTCPSASSCIRARLGSGGCACCSSCARGYVSPKRRTCSCTSGCLGARSCAGTTPGSGGCACCGFGAGGCLSPERSPCSCPSSCCGTRGCASAGPGSSSCTYRGTCSSNSSRACARGHSAGARVACACGRTCGGLFCARPGCRASGRCSARAVSGEPQPFCQRALPPSASTPASTPAPAPATSTASPHGVHELGVLTRPSPPCVRLPLSQIAPAPVSWVPMPLWTCATSCI